MKHLKIAFTLSCLISSSALATTLSEALISAYQTNPELNAARENMKATDEKMFQAISGFLPKIVYSTRKDYNKSDTVKDSRTDLSFKLDPWITSKSKQSGIRLEQNLFNGGRSVMAVQIAKCTIESGREELKSKEQNILLQTVQAYLDSVKNQQILDLSKENVTFYERKLESVQQETEVGIKKTSDLAEAEAAKAIAYFKLSKASGDYEEALATYAKMVGIPAENLIVEKSLIAIPKNQVEFLNAVLKNNPDILNVSFQKKASDINVYSNAAALLPSVDLGGSINKFWQTKSNYNVPYTNNKNIYINLTVPIYQQGMEYSNTRSASAQAASAKYSLKNVKASVTQNATQVWSRHMTALENIKSAEQAVKSAKVALEGIQQGYDEGINTLIDLLNTRENLYQYQIALTQAKMDLELTRYYIAALMGKLTAKDLALPTKIYNPLSNYDKIKYRLVGF
jgi:outer membrane protein